MDLNLPGEGGVSATEQILLANPEVAVVVLTMHQDDVHLRQAIAAGARGYLLKDADPEAIVRAIVGVSQGQLVFHPGIANTIIDSTSLAGLSVPSLR